MARSVTDLALAYDAMQGPDPDDPVATTRPPEPVLPRLETGIDGLRIAVAGGYFARGGDPEAFAAVARVAEALGARATVELPEAHRARAAAYLITAAEGATLHLDRLRDPAAGFRPGGAGPADRRGDDPGAACRAGAAFPPLVPGRGAGGVRRASTSSWRRRHPVGRRRAARPTSSSTA